MSKVKHPIFKCMHRGEKGFTLIELLVVIAILGIIAAVVALNIAGFFGQGKQQAANTEAHQVQTAVIAAIASGNLTDADGTVGPSGGTLDGNVHQYLMNPAMLQAMYTVTEGVLTGANLTTGSQWSGCTFADGQWTCTT